MEPPAYKNTATWMNSKGRNHGAASSRGGFEKPSFGPAASAVGVIDPQIEREIRHRLNEFKTDYTKSEEVFRGLSSQARRRLHEICRKMGLNSASKGPESIRVTTVTRPRPQNLISTVTANETQPIRLMDEQKDAIKTFMENYPIEPEDLETEDRREEEFRRMTRPRHSQARSSPTTSFLVPPPPSPISTELRRTREKLPAYAFRDKLLESIATHRVTLVTGGTGCGKTTQVPQFLLEEAAAKQQPIRIVCTQPRRLPAIAVAERVSKERGERVGNTVGYHIRLEQRTSPNTVLTYCTSGVLLRMLTLDPLASEMTHIILDEIHERETNTDYLLIALKQALLKRKTDLKVILMSATMEGNLELFFEYFDKGEIPAQLYHVDKFFLGEVLAMTGYAPPESVYGGMFHSVTDFSNFTGFPSVSDWSNEEKPQPPGLAGFHKWANQQEGKLHEVQTAPTNLWTLGHTATTLDDKPPFHPAQVAAAHSLHGAAVTPPMTAGLSPPVTTTGNIMNVAHQLASSEWSTSLASVQRAPVSNWQVPPFPATLPPVASAPTLHQSAPPPTFNPGYNSVVDLEVTDNVNTLRDFNHQMSHGQSVSWATTPPYHVEPTTSPFSLPPQPQQQTSFQQPPTPNAHGYIADPISSAVWEATPKFYVPGEESKGFDYAQHMRMQEHESRRIRNALVNALPNRPTQFDTRVVDLLKKAQVNEEQLVNMYMNCGGRQWLEGVDLKLAFEVIKYCMDSPIEGAILVFLPGYDDIMTLRDSIVNAKWETNRKPVTFMLHSQMNSQDQQRVFDTVRSNARKVVLSTNIAEASLTIEDVVFVIDCGKVKEKSYAFDTRISQLKVTWIAKSNAEQRCGRAGRCREGFCFRLYSRDEHSIMKQTQEAEMQRTAIHEVCLHAKLFAPDCMRVQDFLNLAPEPPNPGAVESSLNFLEQLGALCADEDIRQSQSALAYERQSSYSRKREEEQRDFWLLTDLGRLVAQLPLDPQLARLLLFGAALKCLSPILTLVAALSHRDPFVLPLGEERGAALEARDEFGRRDFSDHITLLRIFREFERHGNSQPSEKLTAGPTGGYITRDQLDFCRTKYISPTTMRMIGGIRRQLMMELKRSRVIRIQDPLDEYDLNTYSNSWPMVQAAIVAGCYPGIGFVRAGNKLRKIRTCFDREPATLHPSCIIKRQVVAAARRSTVIKQYTPASESSEPVIEYLAYQELARIDEGLTLRNVTVVPPSAVLLFAGSVFTKRRMHENFNISTEADDDEIVTVERESPTGFGNFGNFMGNEQEFVVEIESWLSVRGRYMDLRRLLQLRFKIMNYFLNFIASPDALYKPESRHLLETVNEVLTLDHERFNFNPVDDLAVPLPNVSPTRLEEFYENRLRELEQHAMPSRSGGARSVRSRECYTDRSGGTTAHAPYPPPFARSEAPRGDQPSWRTLQPSQPSQSSQQLKKSRSKKSDYSTGNDNLQMGFPEECSTTQRESSDVRESARYANQARHYEDDEEDQVPEDPRTAQSSRDQGNRHGGGFSQHREPCDEEDFPYRGKIEIRRGGKGLQTNFGHRGGGGGYERRRDERDEDDQPDYESVNRPPRRRPNWDDKPRYRPPNMRKEEEERRNGAGDRPFRGSGEWYKKGSKRGGRGYYAGGSWNRNGDRDRNGYGDGEPSSSSRPEPRPAHGFERRERFDEDRPSFGPSNNNNNSKQNGKS